MTGSKGESRRPIRILVVASVTPWPLDRGDPIRVFNLSRELVRAGFDVSLWAVERFDGSGDAGGLAEALNADVREYPLDPRPAKRLLARRILRWWRAIRWVTPPALTERRSAALESDLMRTNADLIVFFGEGPAYLGRLVPRGIPILWDKFNVLSASIADSPRWRERALILRIASAYERRALATTTHVSVTSPDEADRFTALFGREPDLVVLSGVAARDESDRAPRARVLGWMGNLGYAPNDDGLRRLLAAMQQSQEMKFELEIVGPTSPSAATMKAINELPNVHWIGFKEELEGWLSTLRGGMIPLWEGAGVKMKTLEFIAAGVPVVATSVAMEGLPKEWSFGTSSDPAELVEIGNRLVSMGLDESERDARMASDAAFASVSWTSVAAPLVALIRNSTMRNDAAVPPTATVIVTHNHAEDVVSAVTAALASGPVIVVDSESSDDSADRATRLIGPEHVFRIANRGFGASSNVGADAAMRLNNCDLIAFLNPDATPSTSWLETASRAFQTDPTLGIWFPQTPETAADFAPGSAFDTAAGPGAAMVVRRACWDQLGGFDENIFLYWEDTDLCWRANLLGWRVVEDHSDWVAHRRGSSGGWRRWASEQSSNGIYVSATLLPALTSVRVICAILARSILRAAQLRDAKPLVAAFTPPSGWRAVMRRRRQWRDQRKLRGNHLASLVVAHRRRLARLRRRGGAVA